MALPDNLLTPISPDSPCGERASRAEFYETLRTLRRPNEKALEAFLAQQSSKDRKPRVMTREIFAPQDVNKLVTRACDALATQSKDLQLAAWLTEGLTWRDGFAGLAEGLQFTQTLLETFWEKVNPLPDEDGDPYERFRDLESIGMAQNVKEPCVYVALGFIPLTASGLTLNQYEDSRRIPAADESGENAREARSEALAAGKCMPEEFNKALTQTPKPFYKALKEQTAACRAAAAALEAACQDKFERESQEKLGKKFESPGFTVLRSRLEAVENTAEILLTRKLEEDPDPPPPEPPPPPPPPDEPGKEPGNEPGGDENSGGGAFVDTGGEPKSKQEAFARVAALARYLRRAEPANPVPYLLVRSLRWGELYGAGADVSDALLAAPPPEVRRQLRKHAAAGQWAQVLELAETSMAADYGRGWLDLQRYSVKACQALGYKEAANAILRAVHHLLTDYPKLPQSTLADDTGAANPETQTWLAEKDE